ncbi:MAG: ABC transporter substrate-binding protein, partial [Acidimicrobiaceae bacterium]|nr:ABC transporter substrate-binding protein [Acidimicrobiaceae bacterium]
MKKKLVGLLAVLLSFAMIAAACGGDDDSSSSASSSSTEGLNIGTLLPETGPLAFLSQPMLQGVNMAIRDINAAGGVNGADVTL